MSSISENCLVSLDMKGKIREICLWGRQEVGKRGNVCCLWDELEGVIIKLKGWLVRAEKGDGTRAV